MNGEPLLGDSMLGPQSVYLIKEWCILECKWISNAHKEPKHLHAYAKANTFRIKS